MINYTEFITAAVQIDQILNEEQLWSLFKKFDVDNTDYITTENLMEAFHRQGRQRVNQTELEEIIKLHDIEKNGKIDFNEFREIFGLKPKEILNADENQEAMDPSFFSAGGQVAGLLQDMTPEVTK